MYGYHDLLIFLLKKGKKCLNWGEIFYFLKVIFAIFSFFLIFIFSQLQLYAFSCYLFLNDDENLGPSSKNHTPKKTKIHLPLNKKAIFMTFHQ